MTIHVRIFGDLKGKVSSEREDPGAATVLNLDASQFNNVLDILSELSIGEDEVSHIFVNHIYSSTKKKVDDGDRVGIFPKNMGLLYKWYFNKED
jgi:molybdopterin converting factor small subunit